MMMYLQLLMISLVYASKPVVIGVLTIPSDDDYVDYPSSKYSYLAASYIKFIESAGAQVIPIPYETTEDQLDKYFNVVNGIFLTGGSLALEDKNGITKYTQTVTYLLQKVLVANDNNDYIPLMAVCLGHQTLHYIIGNFDVSVLQPVNKQVHIVNSLQLLNPQLSIMYHSMNDSIVNKVENDRIVYFNTNWGVVPSDYERKYQLGAFFNITSYVVDDKGVTYIGSSQGKKYPVYTLAYHPEKNQFEFKRVANHTKVGVQFSQHHANMFIEQARQNKHVQAVNLKDLLIYNYQPIQYSEASFMQLYFFQNGQLKI